jgi:hypothetical protein
MQYFISLLKYKQNSKEEHYFKRGLFAIANTYFAILGVPINGETWFSVGANYLTNFLI